MDDFEHAEDWPASTVDAYKIAFDDGDVLCISLSTTRKSRADRDGNWWFEPAPRRRN